MAKEAVVALPLPPNSITGDSILRLPRVIERVSLSRSSIYEGVKKGSFPAPIKIGERAVGWLASGIDLWLAECAESSHKEAA